MFTFFKRIFQILIREYIFNIFASTFKFPSAIILLIVNLIPILGILYLGWNSYDILLLYWLESIVIGIFNFFRILKAQGPSAVDNKDTAKIVMRNTSNQEIVYTTKINLNTRQSPIFFAFFFFFHYGMFTFVHGAFLFSFIGNKTSFVLNGDYWGLVAFFIALMISHGFSYFYNYIGKKEYESCAPGVQMFSPYSRVMIMHFTVLVGAYFANHYLPLYYFIIFILLKIFFDLGAHLKVHIKGREVPIVYIGPSTS